MSKKVLHIVRKFLPYTASFVRNQIVYHIDYEPSVIYAEKIETPFYQEISNKYNTWPSIDGFAGQLIYNKLRRITPAGKKKIRKLIEEQKPDIIHIHNGVDATVFSDSIKNLKIPVIVSFYGYDCTSFPKRFYGYGKLVLQKKVFNNVNIVRVFAMSEDMRNDLLNLGCQNKKLQVHYFGIETEPFNWEKKYAESDTINFINLSGLFEKKGHFFMIDAFVEAQKKTKTNTHLHIIGDGELKEKVLKKIEDVALDNITFHGPVVYGSEKHMNLLKEADVFIHPSITATNGDKEGIPGAVIEAMAAGLPVISTFHAGIPHMISNNDTGILVNENDIIALSEAIVWLANNSKERIRLGKNARTKAVNEYDVKIKQNIVETIYDEIVEANKTNGNQ